MLKSPPSLRNSMVLPMSYFKPFFSLSLAIMCSTLTVACREVTIEESESICNKRSKSEFPPCIKELYPPGSKYSDLEAFLIEDDFLKAESQEDIEQNRFYFF